MSKIKYGRSSTLSGLIDSDSDDALFIENNGMPTPDSGVENYTIIRKGRGRPKAAMPTKVTKTKAPARRTSGRISSRAKDVAPAKEYPRKAVATKGKRKVLADKTNQQHASDTDEVEEQEDTVMGDELDATALTVNTFIPQIATKKTTSGRGKAAKKPPSQLTVDVIPEVSKVDARMAKKRGPAKRQAIQEPSYERVILESQIPEPHPTNESDEEVEEQSFTKMARNARHPRLNSHTRQPSLQRKRAGSASDTERGDPALRRKLGDMTKKYENLNVKYQDLREIGLKEGERNFERLKKQSEEKTAASEKLITSLKADVAFQESLVKESRGLKRKIDSQTAEMVVLRENMVQSSTALIDAQFEIKTLQAKLAANRTAAATIESTKPKVPGSAVKANGGIRMMGTAEAALVAQTAQLKEDLYSDLTGLIVRSVKRETEDDVFDCIQTGRNGTLHFKLAVANESSADSYEDAQCQYVPQLDPSRDKALTDILPDYLVEEITFPRPQAARFYARVVKALTEKMD